MVYSMERLYHVLEVFRESEPYRARRGYNSDYLEDHLRKYNLRTATTITKQPGLWNEKSDSDDEYDPAISNKRRAIRAVPVKPTNPKRKVEASRRGGKEKLRRTITYERGRQLGRESKIVLRLTSHKGRTLIRELGETHGNEALEGEGSSQEDTRKEKGTSFTGVSWNRPALTPGQHAARKAALLKAYETTSSDEVPIARKLRNGKVPATKLTAIRRGCEACKRDRRRCYQTANSKKPACGRCEKEGVSCVVKSDEGDEEPVGVRSASAASRPGSQSEPADQRKRDLGPYTGTSTDTAIIIGSPPPFATNRMCPVPSPRVKRITTNWVHPMDFHYQPKFDRQRRPCHFCNDFRYGIYGCGRAEVEVQRHPGSLKYEEIGPCRGHEPTRMCPKCALELIHIAKCPGHNFLRITDPDPNKLNHQLFFDQLLDRSEFRTRKAVHSCCSFCHSPAVFLCCNEPHEVTLNGVFAKPCVTRMRCKLRLCSPCRDLVELHGWHQRALEVAIREDAVTREIRADMEFMFPHSDLHKAWKA